MSAHQTDPVARYGYERLPNGSIQCSACLACFLPPADGSIMRSHARKCPVTPRSFPIPGVCDA